MGNYKELEIWKESVEIAVNIYKITSEGSIQKDFGLRDQLRRASVSVASNIAEGEGSGTDKMSIRYLYIARGSIAEVETQLIIAIAIGYLDKDSLQKLFRKLDKTSRQIQNLIHYRSAN